MGEKIFITLIGICGMVLTILFTILIVWFVYNLVTKGIVPSTYYSIILTPTPQ